MEVFEMDNKCLMVCAVHPSYQPVSSLPHQPTCHLVYTTGAVTATITRCRENVRNQENKKWGGGYRKGEMNERVSDSTQMTCSAINEFTKGSNLQLCSLGDFAGEYVEFKTSTVSKFIHPSPIILRMQMLLKIGIDT
jgi:hypothetical protein